MVQESPDLQDFTVDELIHLARLLQGISKVYML